MYFDWRVKNFQSSFLKMMETTFLLYKCTLDSGINIGVHLLFFGFFSRGYLLTKESNPLKKVQNSVIWWSRICFFKGLCLLFYPNGPGATFIQGATLIPESREPKYVPKSITLLKFGPRSKTRFFIPMHTAIHYLINPMHKHPLAKTVWSITSFCGHAE